MMSNLRETDVPRAIMDLTLREILPPQRVRTAPQSPVKFVSVIGATRKGVDTVVLGVITILPMGGKWSCSLTSSALQTSFPASGGMLLATSRWFRHHFQGVLPPGAKGLTCRLALPVIELLLQKLCALVTIGRVPPPTSPIVPDDLVVRRPVPLRGIVPLVPPLLLLLRKLKE